MLLQTDALSPGSRLYSLVMIVCVFVYASVLDFFHEAHHLVFNGGYFVNNVHEPAQPDAVLRARTVCLILAHVRVY